MTFVFEQDENKVYKFNKKSSINFMLTEVQIDLMQRVFLGHSIKEIQQDIECEVIETNPLENNNQKLLQ